MVHLKVCHSEHLDAASAIEDILAQANSIEPSSVKGILIFGDIDFDFKEILNLLKKSYPQAKITGCSSFGEMSSVIGWREDSLVVGFLHGENCQVDTLAIPNIENSLSENMSRAFGKLNVPANAKLCILATDALSVSGEEVIKNLREYLPKNIPIIGGKAADHWTFQGTKQLSEKGVLEKGLVAMLISGDFKVSVSSTTGWSPEVDKAIITKSEGATVYRIGNRSALDYYAHHLGTRNGTFGEYPLAIYKNNEIAYLRAPLQWNQEDGSMLFAGEVIEGSEVALSTADRDKVVEAAELGAMNVCNDLQRSPDWALIASCAARRQLLGTRSGEEIIGVKKAMGEKPIMGFYTYGEYLWGEKGSENTPGFLNESFCMVAVSNEQ